MHVRSGWGTRAAFAAAVAVLLTGCQSAPGGAEKDGRPVERRTASPTPARQSGYGAVFLAIDECSSFGRTSFTEVSCGSERAAARVVARHDGAVRGGPRCPATTDFVLHISEQRPSSDEDGDGAVPRGYACMRHLQPPHPGDPGGGGGPRTIVGDCVYDLGDGKVRETACDGSEKREPEFKVVKAVDDRSKCPASTALYVRLGGTSPVGCARPV
ncbi:MULTISPECIES: hypothetical protein [unclassified Streptomyces]|uniref:hypothetical protein n=1 Tax=unclassified Streptomyces TaxID=2593676 RepID=UPI000939029C|nr:hypothetical protein [Streptomyces sp. CB02400]OKK12798.1 hypothetical protein AMK33_06325 [Streptomyces sp. CB02400]